MPKLHYSYDLFQWAAAQERTHRPLPPIVRRIAQRAQVSRLHAAAFCEANGIGPAGAR